jgi:hypothetical protein
MMMKGAPQSFHKDKASARLIQCDMMVNEEEEEEDRYLEMRE